MTSMMRMGLAAVAFAVLWGFAPPVGGVAQDSKIGVPTFQVDPAWPQLPNGWKLGVTSSVAVDGNDHVWVLHRPRLTHYPPGPPNGVPMPEGVKLAPPVLEFDADGKFVQGWGGPGQGFDWPYSEHGLAVDDKNNVWITGNNPFSGTGTRSRDDMLLKFTSKGKFVLQIGGRDVSKGNQDTTSVKNATDVSVYKNEVFVSDGYGNRRVVVFDAETGKFLRMWGAFGNVPTDAPPRNIGATAPPKGPTPTTPAFPPNFTPIDAFKAAEVGRGPEQFSGTPHNIGVSRDGLVYVSDRGNHRIQVFTTQGKYVTQGFVHREGPARMSTSGIAFSPDPEQRFLYTTSFGAGYIIVLDRKTMTMRYVFSSRGSNPGELRAPHDIAVDSKGNLYTAEVDPGNRAQKFVFRGLSSTTTH